MNISTIYIYDGQRKWPKHVEFYNKKIWIISESGWLFKKKYITMHGNMNVKFVSVRNILIYFGVPH